MPPLASGLLTRRGLFVVFCLVMWLAALGGPKPERPTFLRAPSVLTEAEDIYVEVQIVPHPDIRYVTLELWAAEPVANEYDAEMPMIYEPASLVRGSQEPVTERNSGQKTFRFHFHHQPEGHYVLIAKAVTGQFLTFETKHNFQVG